MGGAVALAPIGAAVHAQEYKAQQAGKVARIGYLSSSTSTAGDGVTKAFTGGLRDHGWSTKLNSPR